MPFVTSTKQVTSTSTGRSRSNKSKTLWQANYTNLYTLATNGDSNQRIFLVETQKKKGSVLLIKSEAKISLECSIL
jgi:hypothetical protein